MVTYDGALYWGPEPDPARYYGCPMPNTPAGDFAIVLLGVKKTHAYIGDPSAVTGLATRLLQNNTIENLAGTGGSDCLFTYIPLNHTTVASRGKVSTRIGSGGTNILATGTSLTSTSTFANGDKFSMVLQSNAGSVQLKTSRPGAAAVSEASVARNASFGIKSLGTWYVGVTNMADYAQGLMMVNRALTDTEIANLAAGVDPDTIVAVGDRLALWLFDNTGATIASDWGSAAAATRNGVWTNQPVASPVVPTSGSPIIDVTNEPVPYGAVSIDDDGTSPAYTWTGTYSGFTPSTFQGRIENLDGTTVQDWTALGSFTASAGTWTGTLNVPLGGLYRLQIRDTAAPGTIWRGGNPWLCGGVIAALGQSPHVYMMGSYKGTATVTGEHYIAFSGISQIIRATSTMIGSGLAKALSAYHAASGGQRLLVLSTAVVGTSSTQWALKDASVWPQLLAALDYAKPKRVLFSWLQGASESSTTEAQIRANFDTILANLDADVATARGIGYRFRMLPHNRDTGNTGINGKVRAAQKGWADSHAQAGTKVLLGPWWPDMQTDVEIVGAAQAGAASTLTLAATDQQTGNTAYVGGTVSITAGTGVGQSRTISAYNASTKVLTVSAAWTTIPDATSAYRIINTSPHPGDVGGTQRFGPRYGQDLAYQWAYSALSGRGPAPASATYPNGGDGSVIDVTFTHRHGTALRTPNGGTTATGLAGFLVSEDGFTTQETVASAAVLSADTVRLTLSAPPAVKTALTVRIGHSDPVAPALFDSIGGGLGDLLYDNSGVAPTGGLPVYPTVTDLAVTEAATTGGTGVTVVGGTLIVTGGTLAVCP